MDNEQKLAKLIIENPKLNVKVMYPDEGSDHYYTLGKISKVEMDEYTVDDEHVWFKNDLDTLIERIEDDIMYEKFQNASKLSNEQWKLLDKLVEERLGFFTWEKVIVVYISATYE